MLAMGGNMGPVLGDVIPEIVGSAYVTGIQTFVLDPQDPLVHGF